MQEHDLMTDKSNKNNDSYLICHWKGPGKTQQLKLFLIQAPSVHLLENEQEL